MDDDKKFKEYVEQNEYLHSEIRYKLKIFWGVLRREKEYIDDYSQIAQVVDKFKNIDLEILNTDKQLNDEFENFIEPFCNKWRVLYPVSPKSDFDEEFLSQYVFDGIIFQDQAIEDITGIINFNEDTKSSHSLSTDDRGIGKILAVDLRHSESELINQFREWVKKEKKKTAYPEPKKIFDRIEKKPGYYERIFWIYDFHVKGVSDDQIFEKGNNKIFPAKYGMDYIRKAYGEQYPKLRKAVLAAMER